ncbi:hypothetical protein [Streptosporangium subroseum]|uniref:hypothetical protein n=1 Tax=Streptosporangium subroseum TaxID=106412 RepID=UPI000B7727CF|nr:hypothetical protein [Streptosporangium subroseum]
MGFHDLEEGEGDSSGDGDDDHGAVDVAALVVTGEPVEVADLGEDLLEAFAERVLALVGAQELVRSPARSGTARVHRGGDTSGIGPPFLKEFQLRDFLA